MLVKDVSKLPAIDRLFYWIRERHLIRNRRRNRVKKPWTDDVILQQNFFTNPYRENDKTTIWFRKCVRGVLARDRAVVFATLCFRWFNYIPTGKLLLEHRQLLYKYWNPDTTKILLRHERDNGQQVFTGAFNISASGSTKPKIDRVVDDYIHPLWENNGPIVNGLENCSTLREACQILRGYTGMGGSGFMAYEAISDLRWTYLLDKATDIMTWCNPGPGCKRGLNRVYGLPVDSPLPKDWQAKMQHILNQADRKLRDVPPLEMRDVEHSLCEFDKYERVRLGQGKSKRRFNGVA